MKYKLFIEENFLIDKANTGKLVPFTFNPVQEAYYADLVKEYDIENKGINVPVRENILKARREGFSSLILAIFAADDIMQDNPTETDVLSYKDDATVTFRKRYRNYILTYFAKKAGLSYEQISENINILEDIAAQVFSIDADDIELKHNQAHFQCNTASARVGGRGGVRHKILFSEIAFYPDTEKMLASEIIEATMRQVDLSGGFIFAESTENGIGTYQHRMWMDAKKGRSRFRNRFYGAAGFYSPEEIELVKSEYVDMDSFRRDYPMTEDDLFKGSAKQFVTEKELEALTDLATPDREIIYFTEMQHTNGMDVAEILSGDLERLVRENQGHALYAAVDEAKDIDATVMIVMRDNRRDLRGGVKGIEIDTTRGDWLADWFEKNTNHYVKRVKFSRPSKSLMYSNLLIVIKDKLTKIPICKVGKEWVSDEYKHFWEQMMNLEKETIGEMLVVHHPNGKCNSSDHNYDECPYHDDYPDTWMMVEDLYVELNGVPLRKVKPKVPTVLNAVEKLLNKGTIYDKNRYQGGGTNSFE
jgi:hypothetical protein